MNGSSPNSPHQRAATWSTAALSVALVALPWGYRIPWDATRSLPLVLLVLPLWFGRRMVTEGISRLWGARAIPVLTSVLAAAVVFAIFASTHWAASLTLAATWVLLALLAVLVAELTRLGDSTTRLLLGAMTASVALGALAHWVAWKTGGASHHAFYRHPRLMGIHTLSGAIAAVAMVHLPGVRFRALWHGVGMVAWAGLLWSGSRSPLLGVAAGLSIWLLRMPRGLRRRFMGRVVILALGGLLLSRLLWTSDPGLGWWSLVQRTAAAESLQQATSNRSSFWSEATGHVLASPWIGYGPDGYDFLTPKLEGAQPHNLILQLLLDVGVFGATAALMLLAWCLRSGWKSSAEPSRTAWLAVASASVLAALVDGYFYYPLAAIPAWIALGGCLNSGAGSAASSAASPRPGALARFWGLPAATTSAILVLHAWLFHSAVHGSPPGSPDAPVARLWRLLPSVTFNIDNWVDAWMNDHPQAALELSQRARRHSQMPEIFRVKSAQLLARHGEFARAIAELEQARREVRPEHHPVIDRLLERTRMTQRSEMDPTR